MKALDYLAPAAVLLSMGHLAARPTWVSAVAFLVAVTFVAAERLASAHLENARAAREKMDLTNKLSAEIVDLREELKRVSDAVKMGETKAQLQKRSIF